MVNLLLFGKLQESYYAVQVKYRLMLYQLHGYIKKKDFWEGNT